MDHKINRQRMDNDKKRKCDHLTDQVNAYLAVASTSLAEIPFQNISEVEKVDFLRTRVRKILGFPENKRNTDLPVPLPASFDRHSYRLLSMHKYWVCEKSDGERSLLFISKSGCYLISRRFEFSHLRLERHNNIFKDLYYNEKCDGETLLDGEVIDKDSNNKKFLVFDIVMIKGLNVTSFQFLERMKHIATGVIQPYRQCEESHSLPLEIQNKTFCLSYNITHITDNIKKDSTSSYYYYEDKKGRNKNDGLIFTPQDTCYSQKYWTSDLSNNVCLEPIKNNMIFKWKHPGMNTMDFLVYHPYITDNNEVTFYCKSTNDENGSYSNVLFVTTHVDEQSGFQCLRNYSSHNPLIIECTYIPNTSSWVMYKIRHDKKVPNALPTIVHTFQSIADNVKLKDIINICMTARPKLH